MKSSVCSFLGASEFGLGKNWQSDATQSEWPYPIEQLDETLQTDLGGIQAGQRDQFPMGMLWRQETLCLR